VFEYFCKTKNAGNVLTLQKNNPGEFFFSKKRDWPSLFVHIQSWCARFLEVGSLGLAQISESGSKRAKIKEAKRIAKKGYLIGQSPWEKQLTCSWTEEKTKKDARLALFETLREFIYEDFTKRRLLKKLRNKVKFGHLFWNRFERKKFQVL